MKFLLYILILLCFTPALFAQQQFITQGKIEYERKTNQHAFLDENSAWDEMKRKALPKFVTFYYDLTFKDDRTLFKTGREPETKQTKNWGIFDSENTILTKLDSNSLLTHRSFYGENFLVSDSLHH